MFLKFFVTKVLYPLWDQTCNYLVPRIRIGVIYVVIGVFYWGASRLHRPPKPPSDPPRRTYTCEMRPHPSETSDASGAEGVTNPGETSQETSAQIADLIAPDEISSSHILEMVELGSLVERGARELSEIDLEIRSRTAELDEKTESFSTYVNRLQHADFNIRKLYCEYYEILKTGETPPPRIMGGIERLVRFTSGAEPVWNRFTHSIALLRAEIDRLQDQRSQKVVELQHLHEQKAEAAERAETKAIRKAIRLNGNFAYRGVPLSQRALRLQAPKGEPSGSSEPLPALRDSGQDESPQRSSTKKTGLLSLSCSHSFVKTK